VWAVIVGTMQVPMKKMRTWIIGPKGEGLVKVALPVVAGTVVLGDEGGARRVKFS